MLGQNIAQSMSVKIEHSMTFKGSKRVVTQLKTHCASSRQFRFMLRHFLDVEFDRSRDNSLYVIVWRMSSILYVLLTKNLMQTL